MWTGLLLLRKGTSSMLLSTRKFILGYSNLNWFIMLNTNYLYIMCHKHSHDMCFEASAGVIMNVKFTNIGFMHVRLWTLLCFWNCCGFFCLVVFLFGFPFCLFYSLCPLWLWYLKNQQINLFTETTQYVQHKGLTQGRKFLDHLCHCQILQTESTDWSARETCFRNNVTQQCSFREFLS